jgi:cyclohexanecarboxylate-CoA ligase
MSRVHTTHRHTRATSYRRDGGPWDTPTLDALLTGPRPGASNPGVPRDALVDGDIRLASDDLDALTACLAGGLRDLGVGRRDPVAWQIANGYEAYLLYRACWRLGAVAVAIHHQSGDTEVKRVLDRVEPALVIGAASLPLGRHPDAVIVGGPSLPARRRGGAGNEPDAGAGADADHPHHKVRHFAKLLAADPEEQGRAQPSDVAAVLFTAGSSGEPKGVVHTHRTLAAKALAMPAVHGLAPSDAVLMPAPLAHISGLLNGLLVPGVAGMKSVLMPKWNTALALDLIERERITFMVGPPTFFVGLMHDAEFTSRRVRSLRLISTGGTGVTESFVERAADAFGAEVKRAYGSTEAPTVATSSAGDDAERARTTDGRATGDTELRVVDLITGEPRPTGEEGELQVRGPELFAGYLDEDQTKAAFARGGWFRTGDLAVLDADKWVTITGRLKDIIIRGGENISASEIEAIVERHPDVHHAVAVGMPDETLGERVAVFVEADLRFDLAACRAWFAAEGVARFKTPEQLIRLDRIPVLGAGKPDRSALRRLLATPSF